MDSEQDEIDDEMKGVHKEIVTKRAQLRLEHRMSRHKRIHTHRLLGRDGLNIDDVKDDFKKIHLESENLEKRFKNKKELKALTK